jgi:membrane protein involved in colicin uptake
MAKSKKEESSPADAGATKKQAAESKAEAGAAKPTTKAAGGTTKKKAPGKPAAAGTPSAFPLIDTSLAAEAAARMLRSRATSGTPAPQSPSADASAENAQGDAPDKRETSTFKQLKNSLNKPAGGLGNVLGGGTSGKKGNTGFGGGNRQVGRNQTFGADVNRSGVPRRTGG